MPRAVSIVESMAAIVVMDMFLAQMGRKAAANKVDPAAVNALPNSMKKRKGSSE